MINLQIAKDISWFNDYQIQGVFTGFTVFKLAILNSKLTSSATCTGM